MFPVITIKNKIPKLTKSSLNKIINGFTILIEKIFTSLKVVLNILDIPLFTKNKNSWCNILFNKSKNNFYLNVKMKL